MAGERTLGAPRAAATRGAKATFALDNHRAKVAMPAHILGPRLLFIITTLALVIFGLVMVYSASFVEGFTDPNIQDSSYIFKRQLLLVGVGIVVLVITLIIDYRVWNSFISWIPWVAILVLLILTWAMGNEELGGRRWFDLFGLNLQPSEFAKVALILIAGMLLNKLRAGADAYRQAVFAAVAIGLPILFILLQPDLGTALIALMGIVAVAWFGGFSMKPLAIIVAGVVVVGASAILLAGFRMDRIDAWLDPWAYASEGGYQIVNSFYALADGGVSGVGLGMSHQKYLYLPQPHNDLIFPIIGEELGLIGVVLVVVLFLLFLFSAFRIARHASDLYGRVIAGSAAAMIGFQAFLNMLCMVNLLPMTGKPLPFFSAGGSSIIVTLMLAGLILNVSLRSRLPDEATERRDQLLIIEGGRVPTRSIGQSFPKWQPNQSPMRAQSAKLSSSKKGFRKPPAPSEAVKKAPLRSAPARKKQAVRSPLRAQTQTQTQTQTKTQVSSRQAGRVSPYATSARGTSTARNPFYNPVRDSARGGARNVCDAHDTTHNRSRDKRFATTTGQRTRSR
jgi:cell division protein FtsW